MKKITTGIIALCFFTSINTEAQIWKNIEKKVGKKIEQQADKRLERKIDKTIDKGFDKLEDAAEAKPNSDKQANPPANKKAEPGTQEILRAMGSSGDTPLADEYSFKMGVTYQVATSSKKDKPQTMTLWISDKDYIGMNAAAQKSMFMVMHGGRMIAFMEDKKTYMSLGAGLTDALMKEAEKQAGDDVDPNVKFEKTGTETLLGYACDVYRITTTDGVSKVWIAPSIGVSGFMKSFAAMSRNSKIPTNGPANGMMLKMESKDAKSGEIYTMTATEVHKTPKVIKTSGYKSMY